MSELRIGVSGWSYAGWRGPFYPADLSSRRQRRDVYVYFDNDQGAHAPRDAIRLAERI